MHSPLTSYARPARGSSSADASYQLLDALDEGFFLAEVVYEGGRPVDILYLRANPAATRMLGSDWTGRRLSEIDPGFEPYWLEAFDHVVRTRQEVREERFAAPLDAWFDFLVFPADDAHLRRVANVFRDITARKRTEESLRASESRHAFLLALGDRLRALADPVEIQEEAMRMLGERLRLSRAGYAEDEGDGEHIRVARNHTDSVPGIEGVYRYDDYGPDLLRSFREGRTVVRPDIGDDPSLTEAEREAHRLLHIGASVNVPLLKEGRLVAVLFMHDRSARPWTDEEVDLAEAVAERTWSSVQSARAEAALRDSEEQLRLAKEAVGLGVHDWDPVSGLVRWDERVRELWGVGADEPIGYQTFIAGVHPDDRAATEKAVSAAVDPEGDGTYNAEYRVINRLDGTVRTVLAKGRTTFEAGRAVRLVGTVQDVTEQRASERTQRAAEARQLEQERRAREAAEGLIAVMSHELRTPVTSIYGMSKLLAKDPSSSQASELVHDIEGESERLIRIIEDLLVLSGVGSGHIPLSDEPILLQRSIAEVLRDVERRYPDATFEVDVAVGLPPVLGDTTAVRQILRNLLGNAAKYAGPEGPITVVAREHGDRVEIVVLDRGPGPGDDPERLFALFYRAPHTAKLSGGTGIGLYVARELAAAMGGGVEAAVREGGGASFRVLLPVAAAEA